MNNVERARCLIDRFNRNYRPQGCCCFFNNSGGTPINANFTIGTVTTGAPGSEAAASITGTSPNFILNLTIPQGFTGPTGPAPDLEIGTVTTGAPGTEASVTITSEN